jgi:ABC-type antimicrobial peptide transport system permease subunit
MRSILNKIFSRRLGVGKFLISAFAFLLGLSLVLLALQAYVKVNSYISPKKNLSDYIVLNKEVDMGHTIFGGKAEFTENDVNELKAQPFVEDLGRFNANQFQVKAYAGGNMGFYTDLFFESVPSQFIDNKPYNFKWKEDSDFLPLIVSQDFLNLYNFGYALGRGTPQLSKSTIGLVPLKVDINGPGGRRTFNARVVGFSERITSVLVPEEFLLWANKQVGQSDAKNISRVIIKVKTDKAGTIEKYFEDHNLQVGEDKIKFSRISTIINIVMSVLVFMGTAFIIFSLVIIILNFSLIVAEAKDEISLLLQLGYKTSHIVKHLSFYLVIFIGLVTLISAGVFYLGNSYLINFLSKSGLELSSSVEMEVLLLGIIFILTSFLVSLFSIIRVVRKHI